MPRKSDWTDYIPASGEASVGLNLKGRYGGKGSTRMRRYSRGRSRFSRVPRRSRYWFPNYMGEQYESGWQSLSTDATPVNIRSYNAQAFQVNSQSEPEDLNAQTLLMTQGPIYARLLNIQDTPPTPDANQLGDPYSQFMVLAWCWSVDELNPDGSLPLPVNYRFAGPNSGLSKTLQMLRRKDMLNWGILPLVWEHRVQMYTGTAGTAVPNYYQDNRALGWTRIPPPRIPRGGIRLGPDRMVNLHTTIMNKDMVAASPVVWLEAQFYAGHFRYLLAK